MEYSHMYIIYAALAIGVAFVVCVTLYLDKRDEKRRARYGFYKDSDGLRGKVLEKIDSGVKARVLTEPYPVVGKGGSGNCVLVEWVDGSTKGRLEEVRVECLVKEFRG